MITHRERLLASLEHEETDRVPIDFGGVFSSLNSRVYENLKKHLKVRTRSRLQSQLGREVMVDEEILEMFDIDTRIASMPESRESPTMLTDAWGCVFKYNALSNLYSPYKGPLQGKESPTCKNVEQNDWPEPSDLARIIPDLCDRVHYLHNSTDFAVLQGLPVGPVHRSQYLRGYAEWLKDLILNPKFVECLMDRIVDIWIKTTQTILSEVGQSVDVVAWADDVGVQDGPLMSPEMYKKQIKPWHKKMMDAVRDVSDAKILYHTCGCVSPFIRDFIDLGITALNPVQVSAKEMSPALLKKKAEGKLSFWGAIDTQKVLPYGTPNDVEQHVRSTINQLASGGGYVLASVHTIQSEVSPQNIVAMLQAALRR